MKLKTLLASALVFLLLFWNSSNTAKASEIPNFPSCTMPQGELVVSYDSGIHGIPGDSSIHSGSDKVFRINDTTLIQCFCATNSQGIQTNWWKKNSLTEDEIDTLEKLGWIYIPNGSLWGLENTSYFASNSFYSCGPSGSSGGGSSSSSSSSGGSNSSSNNSSSGGIGGGEVLGQVLGAATGNLVSIYFFILLGIFFLIIFLLWKKPKNASAN
jgi:hypothetical protein